MSNSADASSATRGGIMFASMTACQHHNLHQKTDIHERTHVHKKLMTHSWITLDKSKHNLVRLFAEWTSLLSVKIRIYNLPFGVNKCPQCTFPLLARFSSQAILIWCIQESHLNLVLVSSCDIGDCPARFLLNALFVIVGKKLEEAG